MGIILTTQEKLTLAAAVNELCFLQRHQTSNNHSRSSKLIIHDGVLTLFSDTIQDTVDWSSDYQCLAVTVEMSWQSG